MRSLERFWPAVVALACISSGTPARQARAESDSICARSDVLGVAAERLSRFDAHLELVPQSAGEIGTRQSNVVFCAISVQIEFYDLAAYRAEPIVLVEPRYFLVRKLAQGFEIDFEGK